MLQFSKSTFSAALAASVSVAFSAPGAFADVTNADVWGNWRGYMEGLGYTISASEGSSGNTLTITDITMTVPPSEGVSAISAVLPSMTMIEQGDGTVRLTLPPLSRLVVNVDPDDSEAIEMNIDYAQDGFNMIVSGDAAKLDYAFSANSVTATLADLVVDGTALGTDFARGKISVSDLNGTSSITTGSPRVAQQNLNAGRLSYDMDFNDPDTDAVVKVKGGMANLTSTNTSIIPTDGPSMQDMNAMLDAGFRGDGTVTYQNGNLDMSFSGPDGAGTLQTTTTGGIFGFSMSSNGLSYDAGQTDLTVNALMPDVPIPISMSMAQSKLNFAMPVKKSNEEQDFALGFTMGDFTVSDMLWGMLDPGAQLPRDPATVALDLTGKAKVLFDFLDADQSAALASSGASPGELNALTLKSLLVDAVGARLSGSGDFTFDNSDTASFGGIPRPQGAVDLKLVGGNGLLDKLVAMGLLPSQQAMGARMMMGLFAVAGEEPDTLNSKIEFNEEGHILANGQRIQ